MKYDKRPQRNGEKEKNSTCSRHSGLSGHVKTGLTYTGDRRQTSSEGAVTVRAPSVSSSATGTGWFPQTVDSHRQWTATLPSTSSDLSQTQVRLESDRTLPRDTVPHRQVRTRLPWPSSPNRTLIDVGLGEEPNKNFPVDEGTHAQRDGQFPRTDTGTEGKCLTEYTCNILQTSPTL